MGVVAQDLLGEHADLLVRVDDVEGPVDDPRLLLGEIEVDRVIGHGQRALFALGDAQLANGLQIGLAPAVDHHPIRTADRNRVGDLEKRLFGGDLLEFRQLGLTHFCSKKRPRVVHRLDTADIYEDLSPLAELKHRSASIQTAFCHREPIPVDHCATIITRSQSAGPYRRIFPGGAILLYDCSRFENAIWRCHCARPSPGFQAFRFPDCNLHHRRLRQQTRHRCPPSDER